MSIVKFENRIVDQFLSSILNSCNNIKREKALEEIKNLLEGALDSSCIITTFGSGPLKTYLPESDIDITIVFKDYFLNRKTLWKGIISTKDLNQLKEYLEIHSQKHKIEEVTVINAAVKIVKLYWDGIPIDISFNQIGGICTLNYLEQIDEIVGKDHLFKKAIYILKAWWMYEGRILGSNIGWISSYTLEVLIVFLLINHSDELHTAIDVFFKFFEYDWHKYMVTILGLTKLEDASKLIEKAEQSYANRLNPEVNNVEEKNNFIDKFDDI